MTWTVRLIGYFQYSHDEGPRRRNLKSTSITICAKTGCVQRLGLSLFIMKSLHYVEEPDENQALQLHKTLSKADQATHWISPAFPRLSSWIFSSGRLSTNEASLETTYPL